MIAIEGLCPLLQVFDMPRSLAFYRVLGFEVVHAFPDADACDWALLASGRSQLMLNTAYESHERPPAPDASREAAHSDTALFLGCADVDVIYTYLVEQGIDVKPPKVASYGMKQIYLKDPDGYEICFQCAATRH